MKKLLDGLALLLLSFLFQTSTYAQLSPPTIISQIGDSVITAPSSTYLNFTGLQTSPNGGVLFSLNPQADKSLYLLFSKNKK